MILGDRFPRDAKVDRIRKFLQPGAVVRLHCDFTTPPKPKFLLVACVQPQFLLFIINTSIPDYVQRRQHLVVCEVLVDAAGHKFLDHDSYVDCRQAIDEFTREEVERALLNDMQRMKGLISADVRAQVIAATKACPVLPNREKAWILAALS